MNDRPGSAGEVDIPVSARIVDSGAHVWPHGLIHPVQKHPSPMAATPEDLVARLDAAQVDAVIISPASVYPNNDYVLAAAAAAPDRIFAIAGVDPRDSAAESTIEAATAGGAKGVRITSGARPLELPRDGAALDRLADLSVAFGLVILWTIELPLAASGLVERVAARAPTTPQILDHLGLPDDAHDLGAIDQVLALAQIPALVTKLSGMYDISDQGYPYQDTWPWVEATVGAFGPGRVVWASDWPLVGDSTPYADQVALVGLLPFLDATARRSVLGTTAMRIWSLPTGHDEPTDLFA